MRMRLLFVLTTLPLVGACATASSNSSAALSDAERTAITTQVDSVVADLYDAMNAHDAERVMEHYLPTNEFLYAGVSSTIQGWDTFSKVVSPWYSSHTETTFEYRFLHTQVLSRDAATVATQGGSTEAPDLLWTRALVRRDGKWFVALEHESWPGAEAPTGKHPGS